MNIIENNISRLYFEFPNNYPIGFISDEKDEIVFNLTNKINKHLNGEVGVVVDDEYYPYYYDNSSYPIYCVLIIAEGNVNELLAYPISKNSHVRFFGYGGYQKPTFDRNATSRALFKGSIYYLKYYMRFTVKIKYGSSQEEDESYAYGIRNVTEKLFMK